MPRQRIPAPVSWLGDHDFLIVKADRREPLVVLQLKFASEIAALAEQTKQTEFPRQRDLSPGNPGKLRTDPKQSNRAE